jgi:hypothetical protein
MSGLADLQFSWNSKHRTCERLRLEPAVMTPVTKKIFL